MSNRLRTALIVMISVVWAVNFSMPLFRPEYKPPAEINIAFMGIVGLLTAGYKSDKTPDPPVSPYPAPPQYPSEPELVTPPPRKRAPAKKAPAKKVPAKKPVKKTTAKKAVKKQAPRKRGGG